MSYKRFFTIKHYTYHSYADNWYMELDSDAVENMATVHSGNSCTFYVRDPQTEQMLPVYTILTLVDADREDLALQPGRVVLYRSDFVIYVADLTEYSEIYGINAVDLTAQFNTIRVDLKQEED